jgi:hypothetical protein
MEFKVCIVKPCRPEGQYELPEEQLKRKLDKFYLEAYFDNPEEGKGIKRVLRMPL